MIDIEAGIKSKFYADEFKTDYKDNLKSKVTCNKLLLSGFCSAEPHIPILPGPDQAKHYIPENITSTIKFDMMRSSLLANLTSTMID